MVQVKNATAISENITENVEATKDILDHLRKLKERGENNDWPDGTHLISNVMQELLTTLPYLSLQKDSGEFFAQHTENVGFENKIQKKNVAEASFSIKARQDQFSRGSSIAVGVSEVVLLKSLESCSSISHDSRTNSATVRLAVDDSIPMSTALINSEIDQRTKESFHRSDGIGKNSVSVADNTDQSSLMSFSPQTQLSETPLSLKREEVMTPRSTSFGVNTSAPENFLENGLRYSFRSWGKQHMVRIMTTPGANLQSSLSSPSLALQPSSSLVEQRLQVYDGMTDRGDRWVLGKHENDQRQQQHADHRRREQMEDDT